MKELRREWQSIVKGVQALTQKTEKMVERLDQLERTQVAHMSKARAAEPRGKKAPKKETDVAASDTVLEIIKRSRGGVGIAELKKMTGLNDREIGKIVFRLRKEGQVKRVFVKQ